MDGLKIGQTLQKRKKNERQKKNLKQKILSEYLLFMKA
jgi:hypothetical protein